MVDQVTRFDIAGDNRLATLATGERSLSTDQGESPFGPLIVMAGEAVLFQDRCYLLVEKFLPGNRHSGAGQARGE